MGAIISRARFKISYYFHKKRAHTRSFRKIALAVMIDYKLFANGKKYSTLLSVLRVIEAASLYFSVNFGIIFVVSKFFIWKLSPEVSTLHSDWSLQSFQQNATRSQKYNILLGFTDRKLFSIEKANKIDGGALLLGNTAIVRLLDSKPTLQILLHELGHIFGAIHVNTHSVMRSNSPESMEFDEVNKRRILANRNRCF